MNPFFTADFFKANRKRLIELTKTDGPIVITANGQLQKLGDEAFPFRQDANFWYLTGVDEPDFLLVMDKAGEYLIMPEQSDYQHLFDGTLGVNQLSERSGITSILDYKQGWLRLKSQLIKSKKVSTTEAPPTYVKVYGMYANPARAKLIQRLKRAAPNLKLSFIGKELASLRVVKQEIEIQAIQAAIDLTIGAIDLVKQQLPKLNYEYEIEAIITEHFLKVGADNAWKPIVAAGANACLIHYRDNTSALNRAELVLMDIGALVGNYVADITRTLSIGGQPTDRQKAVYAAVQETQEFAINQLRPGVSFRDCELKVRELTGVKLKELGLIKNPQDKAAIARYYPHAPHYLGLNVHDVGDYSQPLEPGMVLTIEPGIYIKEEGIGVRIEDDVLITQTGHEVLSQSLSRQLV